MAGHLDQMDKYFALLKNQKAVLEKAKEHKGEKPPTSMKRSRWDLDFEFNMIVRAPSLLPS